MFNIYNCISLNKRKINYIRMWEENMSFHKVGKSSKMLYDMTFLVVVVLSIWASTSQKDDFPLVDRGKDVVYPHFKHRNEDIMSTSIKHGNWISIWRLEITVRQNPYWMNSLSILVNAYRNNWPFLTVNFKTI